MLTPPTDDSQDAMDFTPEQQKFLDRKIGAARVKARDRAETDAANAAAEAAVLAEQASLEAAKEWEKLANRHAARVKELEPFEAQAKAYQELIEGMLKDRVKALGDRAKKAVAALPESLTAVERLAWLNANEALFTGDVDAPIGSPSPRKTRQRKPAPKPGTADGATKPSKFPIRF